MLFVYSFKQNNGLLCRVTAVAHLAAKITMVTGSLWDWSVLDQSATVFASLFMSVSVVI